MIGAFKLNSIGKFTVTAVAQVIRVKKGIQIVNNAQIDTAQSKFGGSSGIFTVHSGTADHLKVDGFNAIGNAFTIEGWARVEDQSFSNGFICQDNGGSNNQGFQIVIGTNLKVSFVYWTTATRSSAVTITSTTAISLNTWTHIAVCWNGSTLTMYFNGAAVNSWSISSMYQSVAGIAIGGLYGSNASPFNGHIDEVRISNVARYTQNFTAPTAPFTNDDNTLLLLHMDGTDASTYFEDDNGQRSPKSLIAIGNAKISTAQSKFGGSSIYLDGSGDWLSISPTADFARGTQDWTVEFWHYAVVLNRHTLFDMRPQGSWSQSSMAIEYNGGLYYSTNGTNAISGGTLTTGVWRHIALVRSGNDHKMYINGSQVGSTYTNTNDITIGKVNTTGATLGTNSDGPGTYFSEEYYDEVRVSSVARYTSNFTAPTAPFVNDSNTILLIHGDGTNGSTVFRDDNGVRACKGIQAIGNAQVDTAQSKFGGSSALFDGSGDYLQLDQYNDLNFAKNDFTVEFWARANNTTVENQTAFSNGSSSFSTGAIGICVNRLSSGARKIFVVSYDYSSGGGAVVMWNGPQTLNQWYHVALVRYNTNWYLYIDGTLQSSNTTSTAQNVNVNWNYNNKTYIGAFVGDNAYFQGHLDEVRVSNTARYTANFTPSTTPFQNDSNTVLLLHMDGTDASTVFIDDNGVVPKTV